MASVRPARERDLRSVAEVHTEAWKVAYRGVVPDEVLDGLTVDGRLEGLRQYLGSSDDLILLVAESEDRIVGFALVAPSRDDDAVQGAGEIQSIYVAPDLWRQGVGQALLGASIRTLAGEAFRTATLWVLDTNVRARRFYEDCGWTLDGAVKVEDRGSYSLREVRYSREL